MRNRVGDEGLKGSLHIQKQRMISLFSYRCDESTRMIYHLRPFERIWTLSSHFWMKIEQRINIFVLVYSIRSENEWWRWLLPIHAGGDFVSTSASHISRFNFHVVNLCFMSKALLTGYMFTFKPICQVLKLRFLVDHKTSDQNFVVRHESLLKSNYDLTTLAR